MFKASITVLLLSGIICVCNAVKDFRCERKSSLLEDLLLERRIESSATPFSYFDDCEDALQKGFSESGIYRIKPASSFRPFNVWCDMESDDGGWTIIQTRFDGLIDFFRTWREYRNGFGNVDSEHWLGNNFIHQITQDYNYELKIEISGFKDGEFASAKYSPFMIGSEDEKYTLYIGKFTSIGDITDSLAYHNGSMFSTKDNDNDSSTGNCAEVTKGAWWYGACYVSNLNGIWMSYDQSMKTRGPQSNENVIGMNYRRAFQVDFYSLKNVEMKVRKIRECKC